MVRLAALVGAVVVVCSATGASSGSPGGPVVNGRIAFEMRSDLYTIRPNGSGLMHLTRSPDDDNEPAWSPDGRWIAFERTSRRDKLTSVYAVGKAGGRPRLLVRGARSPSWSPSGRRLAVVRSGVTCERSCPSARDLWTVAFVRGKPRRALAGAWSGDWSPSGRELAAMRKDGIWIVSVGSGKVRKLSSVTGGFGATADWSPDGSKLLLVVNNGLVTVSIRDGSITTLVAPPAPIAGDGPKSCSATLGNPSWSPDGRWIAYEDKLCVDDGGGPSPYWTITIIGADGRYRQTISADYWEYATGDLGALLLPCWSPDSRSVAFIDDALTLEGEYYLATATVAGDYRRLRTGVFSTLAWQARVSAA
jgi:Tol biopolymer transport system component